MARRRPVRELHLKMRIVLVFSLLQIAVVATGSGGTVEAWVKTTLAVAIALGVVWVVMRPRRWYADDRVSTDAR